MPASAYAVIGQLDAVPHDPGPENAAPSEVSADRGEYTCSDERLDHFIERDGIRFAGTHLILDFFGAQRLDDLELMEQGLRGAVEAAGATLLHIHLHHFTPNGGISGVAVLAESHISVHTWPETDYAAFDIFMCGDARPELGAEVLRETFAPSRTEIVEHRRGVVDDPD
ncbi:MAG TPA: adenosylmethionine decarboxylase [Pseudomonadales bacterium]|nr:adenosylmethionine decarboxylase [Pseudomonadales bacterium]